MAERLLVPMDGSPHSRTALEHALTEHPGASVTVLHVIDPVEAGYAADPTGMDVWEGWYESAKERAETVFETARGIAHEHDAAIETAERTGSPSRTIVAYAEENDVDAIVMGSHGRRGVARILLGSVAETVVRRSPVPVTVVR